ncbi:hypothetical protein [Spiroplasma endosymbiont of Agriotes lineatus]|uniref:hypothetical protein n=1 Tax=Spiroplasma endosymbiont of Agriotes lineatus TaxID=3077930 RepID=UPI0030D50B8C
MINDVEEVINNGGNKYNKGIIKYHTTTFFQYIEPKENNNDPGYDIVKINGVNLNAVNGLYTYILLMIKKKLINMSLKLSTDQTPKLREILEVILS